MTDVHESELLVDKTGGVLRLTLNRPQKRNAFNGAVVDALLAALAEGAADEGVRCVVLAGSGKGFCAGADLAWMRAEAMRGQDNTTQARRMAGIFEAVEAFPKPVIGRIHGAAIGGGTGLVAACDIPIAEASTTFAFSEVRLGLAPAVISPFVVRRIGVGHARELFVTGERFDGHRAAEIGLVNRAVVGLAALDEAVERAAYAITRGGPEAVVACKRLARTVTTLPPADAFDMTASLIADLRASAEGQEGMRAFLTKSPPAWVVAVDAEGETS